LSSVDPLIFSYELKAPESANAFSVSVARDLQKKLEAAFSSKQKANGESPAAFVLKSTGRIFCSGGHVAEYAKMSKAAEGRKANREISRVLNLIEHLPVPTLCLVQGDGWGGGLELLSAFDYVMTVPEAGFGFWQRRQGLTFGWGGGQRLLKRISSNYLYNATLQTRFISAIEAQRLGLVNEICLSSRLEFRAQRWLRQVTSFSLVSAQALRELRLDVTASHRDSERSWFERLWWSKDHRDRLHAYRVRARSLERRSKARAIKRSISAE
jgi:enoyl-CoA hydratase/carnithine racemase